MIRGAGCATSRTSGSVGGRGERSPWSIRHPPGTRLHQLDVAAGVEGLARAGQDHAANGRVGVGARQRSTQLHAHLVGSGVAGVGAIERDRRQRAVRVVAHVLGDLVVNGHGCGFSAS